LSELTHDDVIERLSPYLDDELDPVASAEIARHLASCASCAREEERLRASSVAMRSGLETYTAPARLRSRLTSDLIETRPRAWTPWRLAFGMASAAAVVVMAGVAWLSLLGPDVASGRLSSEVVSSHIRSLMVSHLTDVTSTDQHTVKPWFDGRLDFAPPVDDLAGAGFPLLGGRLDYVGGRSVAALVYGRRRHIINLFVWPRAGSRPPQPLTHQGYHVLHGVAGGYEYWAVSDVAAPELATFVETLPFRRPAPR
jgi:anti-sigma factor RsiW